MDLQVETRILGEAMIIGETENILALYKPSGLIVHSDGRTQEPSLAQWLAAQRTSQRGIGEPWISPQGEAIDVAGIVHRLDRTTSGVLLAAKNQAAFEYLKNEFKCKRVEKRYLAYVYGTLEGEGQIVAEIQRSSVPPKVWYARPCDALDPRAAITRWIASEHIPGATLLKLWAITGRTHQLRVHLSSIGHAIVADHLYAPEQPAILGFQRPALHAHTIRLTTPSGAFVIFEAPLPQDFLRAKALRAKNNPGNK